MRCGGSGNGSTSERHGRNWLIEVTLWGDAREGSVKTARRGLRGGDGKNAICKICRRLEKGDRDSQEAGRLRF